MRLVDADALLDSLPSSESGVTLQNVIVRELVECSPTVSCEGCRHDDYPRMCDGKRLTWSEWDSDKSMVSCEVQITGCSHFEAKP